MNEFKRLTKRLEAAQEVLEMLSHGFAGNLDEGTTADDISELLMAVQDVASFVEDEIGKRLTRAHDTDIEDTVKGWLETASTVGARRGEA
jgi:DNA-binding PucR family transcriptional regulator